MASIITCDHCLEPIVGGRPETTAVVVNTAGNVIKSLAHPTKEDFHLHLDLHPHCYDEVLRPAIERIGANRAP